MTENTPQTSASERIEKARELLQRSAMNVIEDGYSVREYERWEDEQLAIGEAAIDVIRALITPPSVGESPEQIANKIMVDQVGEADPDTDYTTDGAEILTMIAAGIRAGIQAAHERWEPADRPSQEQMLRWLGLDCKDSEDDEGNPSIYIHAQHIEREDI